MNSLGPGLFLLVLLSQPLMALNAQACTLMKTKDANSAALKVYFTKFLKEDTSGGRFKNCRLVTKARPDTKLFIVTPFRQDATVVVHRSNWPD